MATPARRTPLGVSFEGNDVVFVQPGMPAAQTDALRPGDRLVSVNGVRLRGKEDAISAINAADGPLQLALWRPSRLKLTKNNDELFGLDLEQAGPNVRVAGVNLQGAAARSGYDFVTYPHLIRSVNSTNVSSIDDFKYLAHGQASLDLDMVYRIEVTIDPDHPTPAHQPSPYQHPPTASSPPPQPSSPASDQNYVEQQQRRIIDQQQYKIAEMVKEIGGLREELTKARAREVELQRTIDGQRDTIAAQQVVVALSAPIDGSQMAADRHNAFAQHAKTVQPPQPPMNQTWDAGSQMHGYRQPHSGYNHYGQHNGYPSHQQPSSYGHSSYGHYGSYVQPGGYGGYGTPIW